MRSGEFAQLCGTTKNTLIHYDELGILKPSHRGANGYRSYTLDDYIAFCIVHAFTQAGFPLKEIGWLAHERDAGTLERAVAKNLAAIKERRAALDRSEALLEEMGRQAREAMKFEPGALRLAKRARRRLLVIREGCSSRATEGVLAEFSREDAGAMKLLKELGPASEIAPYGLMATLDGSGEPVYDALYYDIPPSAAPPRGMNVKGQPPGLYAEVDYEGRWEEAREAYSKLSDFIEGERLNPMGKFYETVQTRLFDSDTSSFRCRIAIQVNERA